jgi:hypothetical protein
MPPDPEYEKESDQICRLPIDYLGRNIQNVALGENTDKDNKISLMIILSRKLLINVVWYKKKLGGPKYYLLPQAHHLRLLRDMANSRHSIPILKKFRPYSTPK